MADYKFYTDTYHGDSIPDTDFIRLAQRATEKLTQYKRNFTVTPLTTDPNDTGEDMAVCAMADALYYYEAAANGGITKSSSVGSVSSTQQVDNVDISPAAQTKELFRCASLYLDIYRGVPSCFA